MSSLLEVRHVSRHFGRLIAVNDVSLSVAPGEVCAVIGPNGAGKTTFFNLISGFFPPTSGTIHLEGHDITNLPPHRRVALGMARTFQITEIFPDLPIRENLRIAVECAAGLRLSPWISAARRRQIAARVDDLLAMAGLTHNANRLAGELSHGDQRATEIMMSFGLNPRLLLLDEPTAGMGDQETHDVVRLIKRLHQAHNIAIILVEHDMRVVFHLAHRIMVLAEGGILAYGTPADISDNETVQQAYLGVAA